MKSSGKLALLIVLELALFLPSWFGADKIDRGTKTIEEYWAETDLSPSELDSLLDPRICHSDRISFLSCANSVLLVAEKLGYSVSTQGQISPLTRQEIQGRITEKEALQNWAKEWATKTKKEVPFKSIWHQLQDLAERPKQMPQLVAAGLNGYLSIAKDPHSYVIPLAYYEEVISRNDARQNNLGFIIRRAPDYAFVRKVFEASPAMRAGLKKGDRILQINGVDVALMLPSALTEALRPSKEGRLSLKVERWEHEQKLNKYLEILRSDYVTPTVTASILNGRSRTGLLSINKFAHETCASARESLASLMRQEASGILLDLRDNPGGQVEEAACVLNLFVPKGRLLFETRYLDGKRPADLYRTENKELFTGPLAVLINSGSASASEIVAGALKDLGRATLIGEKTFGKGTFQDGRLWGSHTRVAVFETQGMYYFPSGWTPQVVGIEPDIAVEFNELSGNREAELFYNPVLPKDLWTGPQSLTWLQMMQCQDDAALWEEAGSHSGDDTQLMKAQEWLFCHRQAGGSL